MNKPLFVFSAPVDTYSGYGARSRDVAKAIIRDGRYDLKILSQRWGNTPFGFLKIDNLEDKQILDCILIGNQLPKKPDVWCQCTVPNEFQVVGEFNLGITAGIETTICDVSWIEGINRMNLTLVSSKHAKDVFDGTTFEKRDNNQKVIEVVSIKKPVEVLFEGIDTKIYNKSETKTELTEIINSIEEEFCYLFAGHWLQGDIGQDRKDVGMLIKTFLETFKGKSKKPALILKTNGSTFSVLDRDEVLEKIEKIKLFVGNKDLPKIYLIHGELTDSEMNELYNHSKIKAMVSFTKGEGFGRPLLEFSVSAKPVIVSNYSGHLDFLKDNSILLAGKLEQIHPSAVVKDMLLAESSWFTVDYKAASKVLEDVYKDYPKLLGAAKKQSYLSRTEFTLDKMQEELMNILDARVSKKIDLVLPKLIRI